MPAELSTCTKLKLAVRKTQGCEECFTDHAATLVGHLIFVSGGPQRTIGNRLYSLNINTWRWSRIVVDEHLPSSKHLTFLIRDELYILGSSRHNPLDSGMRIFDLVRGSVQAHFGETDISVSSMGGAGEYLEFYNMIVLYGNVVRHSTTSFVVAYMVESKSWKVINVKGGVPPTRRGHSSCLHNKTDIFFFGGCAHRTGYPLDNIFRLRCLREQFIWSEVRWQPMPSARDHTGMCCAGNRVFIFGGYPKYSSDSSKLLFVHDLQTESGGEFDGRLAINKSNGFNVRVHGLASKRAFHAVVVTQSSIIVIGGLGVPCNKVCTIDAR